LIKDAQYSKGYAFNSVASVDQFGCAALLTRQAFYVWRMTTNTACESATSTLKAYTASALDTQDCIGCEVREDAHQTPWQCTISGQLGAGLPWLVAVWPLLLCLKVFMGWTLHSFVVWYSEYYDDNYRTLFKKRL
jgi:hypothetical protein